MNSLLKLEIYNSSESEDDEDIKVHEERLPVPNFIKNNLINKPKIREQNKKGRIRNFPHEPGNWATYIYLKMNSFPEFSDYLEEIQTFFEPLKLKSVDNYHISLTKTFILKHHWIQEFIEIVRINLADTDSFRIRFYGLKAFTNDYNTRTFLALTLDEGMEQLKSIISKLNRCLKDYNLLPFYKHPLFHLSLFWCSGNKANEINDYINKVPLKLKNFSFFMDASYCVCTSGNKHFTFNFL